MRTTGSMLRLALAIGAIAGVVVIYLVTVGIVLAFSQRNTITGVVTLGRLMLAVPPLAAGYLVAARSGSGIGRLGWGLLAGALSGVILALALLFAEAVPQVRDVLLRVSPKLLAFIAFDQPATVGALANAALAAVLGLVGAGVQVMPARFRRPLVWGVLGVLIMSMLEPFVRPRLTDFKQADISRFFYRLGGLTIIGAVLVFAAFVVATVGVGPARARVAARIAAADPRTRATLRGLTWLLLILFLLALPQIAGSFMSQVLVFVGLYTLLALGLNIVVGFAGMLDLGYVAFYGVGSYLTALLTSPLSSLHLGWPFWVALPIVILGAATTGLFIGAPVLRLRGDYLAIVTLGFGEIARILFLSDALKPWLGGTQGILGIPPLLGAKAIDVPVLGWHLTGPTLTYYPLLLFCVVAAFVAFRLKHSRIGRAWNAMREDEDVAEATGVNVTNYKLLAFALGASVGCLGGAVFATHLASVYPGTFDILVSITVLAIIILGGMGSIPGLVIGALVLIGLPELLREFSEFRLLVYGAVLVVMMIARPEGLLPDASRRRELHETDEDKLDEETDSSALATAQGS
ncbi:MAG: leucine/isoleucine/valine transporter permease subunit [Chloroflexota bacterium]